jgi:hypothetical protein
MLAGSDLSDGISIIGFASAAYLNVLGIVKPKSV